MDLRVKSTTPSSPSVSIIEERWKEDGTHLVDEDMTDSLQIRISTPTQPRKHHSRRTEQRPTPRSSPSLTPNRITDERIGRGRSRLGDVFATLVGDTGSDTDCGDATGLSDYERGGGALTAEDGVFEDEGGNCGGKEEGKGGGRKGSVHMREGNEARTTHLE
jgi:hypothetical protein